MAQPQRHADPLESVIADGRLHTRPAVYYGTPTVLTVDLEVMSNTICERLNNVYLYDTRIRNQYAGNFANTTQYITQDIRSLVDFAVGQCYNHLRKILERKAPAARLARMNTRCPVPSDQEYPTWLSSTLSSIGPCRLNDGAHDILIVYASSAATMNNYGRANPPVYSEGHYARLLSALKAINVPCTPFPRVADVGSYFPTIRPHLRADVWDLYGLVHPSHYENEDIARIALVASNIGVTPFDDPEITIGYVNDATTVAALTAVAAPAGIPAGQIATSAGRPVAALFNVNYFGLQPSVPAQGTQAEQPAGFYVIGRGTEPYFHCFLAHNITTTEFLAVLRHRLLPD